MTTTKKDYKYLAPAFMVAGLVLLYFILNGFFIQCWAGCEEVNGKLISVINPNTNTNIYNANLRLSNIANTNTNNSATPTPTATATPTNTNTANTNVNLSNVRKQIEQLKTDVDKLPESNLIKKIDNLKKEVGDEPTIAAVQMANVANTTKPPTPTPAATNTNTGTESDKVKIPPDNELRQSLQTRYTSRAWWVFLTTLLCALFVGIVWFAAHVMIKAKKEDKQELNAISERLGFLVTQPLFGSALAITAIFALLLIILGVINESYMPVVDPMFKETIYNNEGIRGYLFGLSNGIVFAAVVFLVAASCAIYYKVRKLNDSTGKARNEKLQSEARLKVLSDKESSLLLSNPPAELDANDKAEKADIEKKLRQIEIDLLKYTDWRTYSKGLLYIGGALLTVGLMRVKVLADWHIAFVNNEVVTLLKTFFDNSLNIQAIFYTILLMAIYLPLSYSLPETSDTPAVEDYLKNKGFFATLTKFAPMIFAIFSPTLVNPITELIKGLYN